MKPDIRNILTILHWLTPGTKPFKVKGYQIGIFILVLLLLQQGHAYSHQMNVEHSFDQDKRPASDTVEKLSHTEYEEINDQIWDEYRNGNYIQAIKTAQQIQNTDIEKLDSLSTYWLASIHGCVARSYTYLSEYSLALWHYELTNKIYGAWNHVNNQTDVKSNIALVNSYMGNNSKALTLFLQVLEEQKAQINPVYIEHTYVQIARMHIDNENYGPVPAYLDSALLHSLANETHTTTSYIYKSWARFYWKHDNLAKAEEYYKKAIELTTKEKIPHQVIQSASFLAELYIKKEEFEKSIDICEKYLIMADSLDSDVAALNLAKSLFTSYKKLGRYKDAMDVDEHYSVLRDSLEEVGHKNSLLLGELRQQAASEVESLKYQEEINQQTIKYQQLLLWIAVGGILLLLAVSIVIYKAFIVNRKLSQINEEQSNRLRQLDQAKSRFFANISHDLRTPLSLLMGSIDQLMNNEDIFLNEKAERQLKTGLKNAKRMVHLTNEINELIKLEDSELIINKAYINLDEILELFVSMFESMAEMREVKLSYSRAIFDEPAIVAIDVNQFEKVLFNLMTNALKHTKKGDFVTISLDKLDDQNLSISIIDSGEGIPSENVPYIFERYYQAPKTTFKSHEGFGIGLALVKEIINKHGFQIEVKSKHKEGTQFKITLPLETVSIDQVSKPHKLDYSDETRNLFKDLDEVESTDKPVVQITKKSETEETEKPTLLVVEDHPEVRQYITDIIDPHYHILTADNGKRALNVLESQKEVDLIITDLMMPWMDGFELLGTLKNHQLFRKIPVLVLSARTSEKDQQRVLELGVNDFLFKPFESKELLHRIKNMLEKKSQWDSSKSLFINNKKTLDDLEKSIIDKVEGLVIEHINDSNLSVGFLADKVSISERNFYRMIKRLTECTPLEYIKEIRLQYAKKLIAEKRVANSSEVAKLIGMTNVSHFNNQFKSRFGKKPIEIIDSIK